MRPILHGLFRCVVVALASGVLLLAATPGAGAETADERALRSAAGSGDVGHAKYLLARGTDPNVPDHNGWTAVHRAAIGALTSVLRVLLEAGGKPDVRDEDGNAPLHLAAAFPYFEPDSQASIRVLLFHGANPNLADRGGRTPLHVAARSHQEATSIRELQRSGASPNRAANRGNTPLHYAVGRDSKFSADVVEALVNGGARGDAVGSEGETPLQLFARVGTNNGRIVDALLDAGADPDAKNPDGETPMHTAIRNGGNAEHPKVVEALLAAGADPCIKDSAGYIPYNTAREGGTVHGLLANAGGSDIGCEGSDVPAADYAVDPADWTGETTTRANIRSGPGTDHDVKWTLDGGVQVQVTGTVRNTDWLRVQAAGDTAFIHASLVREAETSTAMEMVEEDSDEGTAGTDSMRVLTWTLPVCVTAYGGLGRYPTWELYQTIDMGLCVGAVEIDMTSRCDTRKSQCNWPCSSAECVKEWTTEPAWPFADHAAEARAVAEAARENPESTKAEGLARAEAFSLYDAKEQDAMPQDETEAQVAAMVDEEGVAEETGGESAPQASGPPDPVCLQDWGEEGNPGCWMEITDKAGCYFWYIFSANTMETVTWSGDCADGKASGTGQEVWTFVWGGNPTTTTGQGSYVDGKKHGHWLERWGTNDSIQEGPYVDGLRHGYWEDRRSFGGPEFLYKDGHYEYGKRHGRWVYQKSDEGCDGWFEYDHGEYVSNGPGC